MTYELTSYLPFYPSVVFIHKGFQKLSVLISDLISISP